MTCNRNVNGSWNSSHLQQNHFHCHIMKATHMQTYSPTRINGNWDNIKDWQMLNLLDDTLITAQLLGDKVVQMWKKVKTYFKVWSQHIVEGLRKAPLSMTPLCFCTNSLQYCKKCLNKKTKKKKQMDRSRISYTE